METKEILKFLRKSKGFANMKDFCEAADISINTYQNYESGKRIPTAEILIKLADFYGVTTDYLLGRESTIDINIVELVSTMAHFTELEKDFFSLYISMDRDKRSKFLSQIAKSIRDSITQTESSPPTE